MNGIKNIINFICDIALFIGFVYSFFHIYSYIELPVDIITQNEKYILKFVLFVAILIIIKFVVYSLLRFRSSMIFAIPCIAFVIVFCYANTGYVIKYELYDQCFYYIAASILYFVISIGYIYQEIYFGYYKRGRLKGCVSLSPMYKRNKLHIIFNAFYISAILIFILFQTDILRLGEYIAAIVFIAANVCVSNTFTDRVALSTSQKSNKILLLLQLIFFVTGIILIINYFISGCIMALCVGVIYVLSLVELLFICRYKQVDNF